MEELKSSLSKEQFIHKLQFEKEFKIYEELWKKLVDLKEATEKIIPINGYREPGKDDAEIDKERAQIVAEAYSEVRKIINYNKPFYDEKVYENTEKILSQSFRQVLAVRYPNRDESKHFEKAEERIEEIFAVIYKVEVAIRERILNIGKARLIE